MKVLCLLMILYPTSVYDEHSKRTRRFRNVSFEIENMFYGID